MLTWLENVNSGRDRFPSREVIEDQPGYFLDSDYWSPSCENAHAMISYGWNVEMSDYMNTLGMLGG